MLFTSHTYVKYNTTIIGYLYLEIQWNPFIGTTVGTDRSGPIREVVLLEGLKSH